MATKNSRRLSRPSIRPWRRYRVISQPDILVLGGGIIGLSCALELHRRGLRVEVVERGLAGGEASAAAAGMLAPLAEIEEDGPMLAASRASRDLWRSWAGELIEESGLDIDYDDSGAIIVDTGEGDRASRLARNAVRVGEQALPLDRDELVRWIPDLAPGIQTGTLLPGEHRVDNRLVCQALVKCLKQRQVPLHEHSQIDAVLISADGVRLTGPTFQGQAERVLVTSGAWAGLHEGLPGLPVRPVRGQMFELAGIDWPWLGSVWSEHLYVVRRAGGRLLVGATVEEAGFANHPTPDGQARLFGWCHDVFPRLGEARLISSWSGLRPGTPDSLPLVGQLADLPVWVATGHYRNGILLAPWTASTVAELLMGEFLVGEGEEKSAFSPSRFMEA